MDESGPVATEEELKLVEEPTVELLMCRFEPLVPCTIPEQECIVCHLIGIRNDSMSFYKKSIADNAKFHKTALNLQRKILREAMRKVE